jgi:hypothetical protein
MIVVSPAAYVDAVVHYAYDLSTPVADNPDSRKRLKGLKGRPTTCQCSAFLPSVDGSPHNN